MWGGKTGLSSSWSCNNVETVQILRSVMKKIINLSTADAEEVRSFSKNMRVSYDLVSGIKEIGGLPVVQIAAGGVETLC